MDYIEGKKYLLKEDDAGYFVQTNKVITESIKTEKSTVETELFAVLQKYGVKNNNGRIYPKALLEREVEKYKFYISDNTSLLELTHPESPSINLGNVAAKITEIWWEGVTLMGKLKILVSDGFLKSGIISCSGDMTAMLHNSGVKLGISSRGVGSLKKVSGDNIVQDDYELICWDIVHQPSSKGSWISGDLKNLEKYIDKTGQVEQVSYLQGGKPPSKIENAMRNFLSKYN